VKVWLIVIVEKGKVLNQFPIGDPDHLAVHAEVEPPEAIFLQGYELLHNSGLPSLLQLSFRKELVTLVTRKTWQASGTEVTTAESLRALVVEVGQELSEAHFAPVLHTRQREDFPCNLVLFRFVAVDGPFDRPY
jgi:hypothetical protein